MGAGQGGGNLKTPGSGFGNNSNGETRRIGGPGDRPWLSLT